MNLETKIRKKKIALLCTGASLSQPADINLNQYDTIIGVNRIYLTGFADKIDILFHNASQLDNPKVMLQNLLSKNPNVHTFFMPSAKKHPINELIYLDELALKGYAVTNLCGYRDFETKKRGWQPLTGLITLEIILKFRPESVDIYGMDFYQAGSSNKYHQNLEQFSNMTLDHDMKSNYFTFMQETGLWIPEERKHMFALRCRNIQWHIDKKIIEKLKDMYS